MFNNSRDNFGDIIFPPTDSENFSGKAYTIREGEILADWLHRGLNEEGDAREKFRKTILGNGRAIMKARSASSVAGFYFEAADPSRLSAAYEHARARALDLVREASLDAYGAEFVISAFQYAYATLSYGPNMADLVQHRLMHLCRLGSSLADASAGATRWAQDQIVAAKVAPANRLGDDDEAIAAAILKGMGERP